MLTLSICLPSSTDDLVNTAPNQKVLMVVDIIFPGWMHFKDLAMAQFVPEFLESHKKILEYEFDTLVGRHLTRSGTAEDVQIQQEYFEDIQTSAAKVNQEIFFVAIGQEVGFETMVGFPSLC